MRRGYIEFMIKSELKKVRNLLDESIKYIVPSYQRNFTWKRDHAEEFFEDISSGSIFLGTIVLDTKNEVRGSVDIVDGQQRITTIFIFLAACRHHAQKIGSESQAVAIQTKISFIDDTSGKANASKLVPSPSIAEVFEKTISNPDWNGRRFEVKSKKRQANKIRPIYEFFADKISRMDKDELAELLKKIYESTFIKIEVQETKEAFDIFERTNARGMELNAADLLKNYLFANSSSEHLIEDWDEIINNSGGNTLRLLKYYYVSSFGLISKNDLFKEVKKHGQDIGPDKLLARIKDFAFYYNLIIEGNFENITEWAVETENDFFRKEYNAQAIHRTFEALRLFGVSQGYPLLVKCLSALDSISDAGKREKASEKVLGFFQLIEKFHFLNYAVCQRPGNQIEGYYAEKCEKDITAKNITEVLKEISAEIKKDKVVGSAEFIEKFTELSYGSDSALMYYISDRFNNFNRKGGQYICIYNPDKKLLRRNYDIDHLISQSANHYDFNEEEISDYIDSVGNLLVISKHTNGSMQDRPIGEKITVLEEKEAQNLSEAGLVVQEWRNLEWSPVERVIENIRLRAKRMAERAYTTCWSI